MLQNQTEKILKHNNLKNPSGIVLLAKRPGKTSFSSLFTVKNALKTKKVGHTGTLDSFASGLLVVCTGALTRLASRITAFDKTYEAVIKFGEETDTLDPSGNVIKTSDLPTFVDFFNALKNFSGQLMQKPPAFSAIHVNGHRASDLMRDGKNVEIPTRKIFVYKNQLKEILFDDETFAEFSTVSEIDNFLKDSENSLKKVRYARVLFEVSKGTYIRSLARDIAAECKSSAHLIGLLRTKVGNFKLEDSAGFDLLDAFSIKSVISALDSAKKSDENSENSLKEKEKQLDLQVQQEILQKIQGMTPNFAKDCGFLPLNLKKNKEFHFFNGKPLNFNFFESSENFEEISKKSAESEIQFAVFSENQDFCGIINLKNNRLFYGYVVLKSAKL